MKSEYQILIVLLIHWIADFLLQSEYMARNKSKDNNALAIHVAIYSFTFFIVGIFFFNIKEVFIFTSITFICHFITDYFTSRWTGKLYLKEKYYGFPAFFSVIGLDQYLHQLQLIITYVLLRGL